MVEGDSTALLVALFGAAAFAAVVFAFLYPLFAGDRASKRVASVTESRAAKVASRSAAETAASRKKQVADTLKDLEQRQKAKEKVTLRTKLQRAGIDAEPKVFWIASVICGVITMAIGFFMLPPSPYMLAALACIGFVGTFGLPVWFLSKMIKKRQAKFLAELANAIDVVVRGVKSGLPLGECLQIISRESPEPLASEFREVVNQQRMGVTLAEALDRLTQRVPLSEVKFLTIVIAIQQQAGGNLSEALGNLSSVLRDRFRMQMKVKALSAEAKSSAMVLGCLPPGVMGMVYVSAPDYIAPLFTTSMGNMMMLGGGLWMGCGILMMKKMINFKF